jgi:hypothetical protein
VADSKGNGHTTLEGPGHEVSDVRVAGIAWFIVGLAIAVVFIGWLMTALFNSLEGQEKRAEIESRPSPFAAQRPKLPPEPRLQLAPESEQQISEKSPPNIQTQHPLQEMEALRREWKSELDHYGWVDEKNGIVRIPIEEAKRRLLQQGVPTRPAGNQAREVKSDRQEGK